MIKIGITGGIGSGKSVVAALLELSGIPVYIADTESKLLTATSPVIREKLVALFGEELYTADGLDKKRLASHIFGNPERLGQVNAIIHPEVNRHFLAWAERQNAPVCAIESAILFESGFNRVVDTTLMVYAPMEIRIRRALERDARFPRRDHTPHRKPVAGRSEEREIGLRDLQRRRTGFASADNRISCRSTFQIRKY